MTDQNANPWADRLRAHIDAGGTTHAEFAAALGTPASHLSRLLSGRCLPSEQMQARVAEATGGAVPSLMTVYEAAHGQR